MNEKVIQNIVDFINQNGDRFRMLFAINSGSYPVAQKLVTDIIKNHGSIFNYIKHYVDNFKPSSVVICVKKKNGTGSGREPQDAKFNFNTMEAAARPAPTTNDQVNSNQTQALGNPKTEGLPAQYAFQLEILKRQLNELEAKHNEKSSKYKKLKKTFEKLKIDYDTQEKRHEYENRLATIEGKNTLAGLVEGVAPHAKELLGAFISSKAEAANSLEGTTDERVKGMIEALRMLTDENQIAFYYETFEHLAKFTADQPQIFMNNLRQLTSQKPI